MLQAQLWQLQFPQFSTQSQLADLVASITAGASAPAAASVKTEDS
jgi:2-C-methyl-D-erythritol 4-phosphate cytidylyltransferase